jgi:hypothetical protein
MIKAKAERDQTTVEKVYHSLKEWTRDSVKATERTVEDLLLEICARELKVQEEYAGATTTTKGTKKQQEESDRASLFKPIAVVDKDKRNEDNAVKRKNNREASLTKARGKSHGWMLQMAAGLQGGAAKK